MELFPLADPIPLPAPIWLLKGLHITTLALHFAAMEVLLGGLLVASILSVAGGASEARTAAKSMARRLPVIMTFVINLGVPPLLFAQVLYGKALYSSSVLIGAWWISVIFLLMGCYWLLYRFAARLDAGKSAWWVGLTAWALGGAIAKIYTSNMTLMLRPEVWQGMYQQSAAGTGLPPGDPALLPRWAFMLTGGLLAAGLWMIYLAGRKTFVEPEQRFLSAWGGRLTVVMSVVLFAASQPVIGNQPGPVLAALKEHALYGPAALAWMGAVGLAAVLGLWAAIGRRISTGLSWVAPVLLLLVMASLAIYRDGIRDLTLQAKGFDVWQQQVATNWGVVVIFLVLFVAGLGALGWLVSVVARARKDMEGVTIA